MLTGPRSWGKILVGVRFEKMVETDFVEAWTQFLLAKQYRKGDAILTVKDRVAHKALNEIVRFLLLRTECDSLLTLDSDAVFGPSFLEEFRSFEPGWDYDALQAFYTRRGWPPEPIWLRRTPNGGTISALPVGEGTEEIGVIGTHCALFRREIFERLLEEFPEIPIEDFDFFHYPRHKKASEDAALSDEVQKLGFRLGATTALKVGHVGRIVTGWETYREYMSISGDGDLLARFWRDCRLVGEYLDEDPEVVAERAAEGSANVRRGLEAFGGLAGKTAEETRQFYGTAESGYLFELVKWNSTRFYERTIAPLRNTKAKRALVIGAGIGGEVDALLESDVETIGVFELPGELRDFLYWKYDRRVSRADRRERIILFSSETLPDLAEAIASNRQFDLVIAVDTIEHIHADDLLPTLDAVDRLLAPGGELYVRNNFGNFDSYPMHFDHSLDFERWIEGKGYILTGGDQGIDSRFYWKGVSEDEEAQSPLAVSLESGEL